MPPARNIPLAVCLALIPLATGGCNDPSSDADAGPPDPTDAGGDGTAGDAAPDSTSGDAATDASDAGGLSESHDVVVVGAGSGGIGASVQAARMGMDVLLLEPTDWIGGQMTAAGVTSMDGGNRPPGGTGIYQEMRDRITAYYGDPERFPPDGKSVNTCYGGPRTLCFEPHVGRQILQQMLDGAGVTVRLRTEVVDVLETGDAVTGVVTRDGTTIASEIVVDATEHGDVIPLTGADYRVGRSPSDAVDPDACIQDITYLAVIREYPDGPPPDLVIDEPPPGYDDERRAELASKLVDEPGVDRFPSPPPGTWLWHSRYRGMPDSTNPEDYDNTDSEAITRTGVNYLNDYPGHYFVPGDDGPRAVWRDTLKAVYLEDREERRRIDCEAKLRTMQVLYYFQNDLGKARWAVADDEGYDTEWNIEHNDCDSIPERLKPIERLLPPVPYVRESRRIVPIETLTAEQIRRPEGGGPADEGASTSLAVGDYPTDLHNCGTDEDLESRLGETADDRSGSGPFEVPYEAFIPVTVDGLLPAEKNIGVTRLANGATRLQPITMSTGQAVGALAALAVDAGEPPRAIDPVRVQDVLVDAGAAISRRHFDDVPLDHPRWADVQMAVVHEVLVGAGGRTFGVDAELTRAGAAVALVRLLDVSVEPRPGTPTFEDVPSTHFAYGPIEVLAREGWTAGCATDPPAFCPAEPLTRGAMAVFLANGLGLDVSSPPAEATFDDVPDTDGAYAAIEAVTDAGLVQPCDPDRFCPADPVSRGEAAEVIRAVLLR